jgi:sugar/nucleoside kinase (ribokinase family)
MRRAAVLSVGNAIVDVLAPVPRLPVRGGDVLAPGGGVAPGGSGLTALRAAAEAGARCWFAGPIGTGPFGDLVRASLGGAGIVPMLRPVRDRDTGCSVVLTEPDGERTFVTVPGAEATVPALGTVAPPVPGLVHVTGYGLQAPERAAVIVDWVRRLPQELVVLVDPGPLEVDPASLDALLARADWWSGNAEEAARATGVGDPEAAATLLAERMRAGVVVRDGRHGCVVALRGRPALRIAPPAVATGTTNGAGDAHVGAFLAALGAGHPPAEAALSANAAAARRIAGA